MTARSLASAPGLVDRATSHVERIECRGGTVREILGALSRARRLRRMRRTVLRFADLARDGMGSGERVDLVMVTLTYANCEAWEPGHVSRFVQRCVEWLSRRGHSYAYAWVLEMQRRGAPHYHVLFWLPRGVKLPAPDVVGRRGSLVGMPRRALWPFGMTRIEKARSPGYIVKYASKGDECALPAGARLFGVGAAVLAWRRFARWSALPAWLREVSVEGDAFTRLVGAGWVNRRTGEIHASEWRFGFGKDEVGWLVWFERRLVCRERCA